MPRPVLEENGLDATVTIDGRLLPGFIFERRRCGSCRERLIFHLGHQASLCPRCNRWLDYHCDDPSCFYCDGRAELPLG
ncbi:MAG: hypothetical protein PVH40_07820 [Gemmatimonadales bacterium]|jgi:hypothetical protein